MKKVQKPSNSECYTPSSEPFRIYLKIYAEKHFTGTSLQGMQSTLCPHNTESKGKLVPVVN
jgi:hypothetical protein